MPFLPSVLRVGHLDVEGSHQLLLSYEHHPYVTERGREEEKAAYFENRLIQFIECHLFSRAGPPATTKHNV